MSRKNGGVEGDGGKIGNSDEVNTRGLSRGKNELIGEFKRAAGDVISTGGGYEVHVHSNKN